MTSRIRVAAVALAAAALMTTTTTATAAPGPAPTAATEIQVSVDQSTPAGQWYADVRGISIGAENLARPGLIGSPTLARYLHTMSPTAGVLRVGGSGADKTFWTAQGETPPAWSVATIEPAGLAALARLAHRTGWKVVLAVNLAHDDPQRAADEVAHATRALGGALQWIEIGNEPNFYYPDADQYWTKYESYVDAIRARTPQARFIGPGDAEAPGVDAEAFRAAFVAHELGHPDVAGLNRHHYRWGACGVTIPTLLDEATHQDAVTVARHLSAQAGSLHVPATIGELNSSAVGGCPGVSDTLAAALWTMDHTLASAEHGVRGTYYHTTLMTCGHPRPDFADYTSMCAPTDADAAVGHERARAPYYGLLGLRFADPGTFLTVNNSDDAAVRAYAIRSGGHLSLVLINVTDPATNGPADVAVDLGRTYHAARSTTLATTSPDGLAATTGIAIGGGTMRDNGTFTGARWQPAAVHGNELRARVAAGSAVIVNASWSPGTPVLAPTRIAAGSHTHANPTASPGCLGHQPPTGRTAHEAGRDNGGRERADAGCSGLRR